MNPDEIVFIIGVLVLTIMPGITIYRRYTGLSFSAAAMLLVVAFATGLGLASLVSNGRIGIDLHSGSPYAHDSTVHNVANRFVVCILLPCVVLPFAVRLYQKWIGAQLTEAEKAPGIEGIRAWLGAGNVICALFISVSFWRCFEYSILPALFTTFGALLIYPVLTMVFQSAEPVPSPVRCEGLTSEREKVLQLLESGRITASESAELLNALGHTAQSPQRRTAIEMNPQRRIILIGSALLLIGFFLPWFSFDPAKEVSRFMGNMTVENVVSMYSHSGSTVNLSGGDIGRGLGWLVLLLGVASAVIPYVTDKLDFLARKKVSLVCLGLGAVVLMYLLSGSMHTAGVGILLCLVGYALEIIGTIKEPQTD